MDTFAGRCDVPPVGPSRDFHPLAVRPAGRTKKKADKIFLIFQSYGVYFSVSSQEWEQVVSMLSDRSFDM